MQAFEYARPTNKQEAVQLLQGDGDALLGGGTDLLGRMKDYLDTPRRVISLNAISELRRAQYGSQDGLRLGAALTLDEIAGHDQVRSQYPALAEAAGGVGGPQIRAVGTLGGNLCQRPRCWYYRNGFGLLATHRGRPMVPEGDNRYHAIFGNDGPAYFVGPSTLAPLLIALGARISVLGPGGEREMPLEELYVVPRTENEWEFSIARNELVTEVIVPPPGGVRTGVYEIKPRLTLDWPVVTAAAALRMSGNSVGEARIVLGQVAPTPWTSERAQNVVTGNAVDAALARKAGEAAVEGARPLSRNAYKVRMAQTAVRRALLKAAGLEVES